MRSLKFVHFSRLPVARRLLFTGVLSVLGLGFVFAMFYIYSAHSGRDGDPMFSVKDIVIAYSGSKTGTKLESALKGPMSNMLPAGENQEMVQWVKRGATEVGYQEQIKEIFDKRCISCHKKSNHHLPQLEDYAGVMVVASADTGANLHTLVRVSHIHMFGFTFIFFVVGYIFSHSYMRREWLKVVLVAAPFVAIAVDISSWYLTKLYEPFAWAVAVSLATMGISFAIQFSVSIYQMWFYRLAENARSG